MASDTNVNLAECLVTKSHWGYDQVINVCSGKATTINWALSDWWACAMGAMLALLFAGIVIAAAALIVALCRSVASGDFL